MRKPVICSNRHKTIPQLLTLEKNYKVTSSEVASKAALLLGTSNDPLVKSVSASALGQAEKKVMLLVPKKQKVMLRVQK